VLSPYEAMLARWLGSDLTRGPVSAFAAHASVGPHTPGGALFAFWQAAYHLYGQWHACGGAVALIDALIVRLRSYDGQVRCSAPVVSIEARGGAVRAVLLESGERIEADAVVAAIDPRVTLLRLLDPPASGRFRREIEGAHASNAVQALVHVATDRLPPYPGATPDDYQGLQSFVDTLAEMKRGFLMSEAGLLPDPLPLYAFTTSATDGSLAPPGCHTIYLACPSAPAHIDGGWHTRKGEFVERCLQRVEQRAPGFRNTIIGVEAFTPLDMERTGMWPGAHPMHLDITLDQLGIFRPTRRLSGHRTPVEGLYISGAGTNPTGGIAGTPGRMAANALLQDWQRKR